jgi:hypothetical protein
MKLVSSVVGGFGGRFVFLTVNILTLEAVYWITSLVAETSRLMSGTPIWGATAICYSLSVFVAALGFMLTVLFLKFCWFEKNWREQVRETATYARLATFRARFVCSDPNLAAW